MTVDLGRIKIIWKSTYSAGTSYVKDDVVFYNGSAWICKQASTGNTPVAGTYWDLMVEGTEVQADVNVATISSNTLVFPTVGRIINFIDSGSGGHTIIRSVSGVTPGATYKFINSRTSPTNNVTLSASSTIFCSTTGLVIDSTPSSPGAILGIGVSNTIIRIL